MADRAGGGAGPPPSARSQGVPVARARTRRAAACRTRRVSIFITELEAAADGPTLAVKALFDTAGVRTTYGSAIFRDHVPDETAASVALLQDAGYVMVGKANLHEFAWGITSENDHYGWVPNPTAPGHVAGGASGGSAGAPGAGPREAP